MSNPTPLIQGKRSAYWLFVKLSYDEYTQNHPDESVSVTAFSQTCMEKWRSMNKKKRSPYYDLALEDMARYYKEVDDEEREMVFGKDGIPCSKMPSSAFIAFCQESRQEITSKFPSLSPSEMVIEIGRIWHSLSDEEREVYEKKEVEDKQRYSLFE